MSAINEVTYLKNGFQKLNRQEFQFMVPLSVDGHNAAQKQNILDPLRQAVEEAFSANTQTNRIIKDAIMVMVEDAMFENILKSFESKFPPDVIASGLNGVFVMPTNYPANSYASKVRVNEAVYGIDWNFIIHHEDVEFDSKGEFKSYTLDDYPDSGVTIGIGYDLGAHSKSEFKRHAPTTEIYTQHEAFLGLKGKEAKKNYPKQSRLLIPLISKMRYNFFITEQRTFSRF